MKNALLIFCVACVSNLNAQTSNTLSSPCTNGGGTSYTVSMYPSKDASVGYHYGYPSEDTNYGDAGHNSPFSQPSVADVTEENMGWALIEFSLIDIPSTAEILSAELDLFAYTTAISAYISGHIGDNASWVSRITEDWEEMEVTWNTKPDYSTDNQVAIGPSVAYNEDFIGIDVTEMLEDMLADPANSYGFSIRLQEESPTRGLMFCSSDVATESKWPKLTINYCDLATGISNPAIAEMVIYQNIETGEIFISAQAEFGSILQYHLLDLSGKICMTNSASLNPGLNTFTIDLKSASIAQGTYILQCNTVNESLSKLIIVRN